MEKNLINVFAQKTQKERLPSTLSTAPWRSVSPPNVWMTVKPKVIVLSVGLVLTNAPGSRYPGVEARSEFLNTGPLLIVVSERKITSERPTICPEP